MLGSSFYGVALNECIATARHFAQHQFPVWQKKMLALEKQKQSGEEGNPAEQSGVRNPFV